VTPIGRTVIDLLLVELLVDGDAHAIDEHAGHPLIRETAIVCPHRDGAAPALVFL